MRRKDKDDLLDDYEKLEYEIMRDKVEEIFRTRPEDYVSAMEEAGFTYFEDDDIEQIEENNAEPLNENQRNLVAYFEGSGELSRPILMAFLEEKGAEAPNLPLVRKYFKQANQHLKRLILYGLDHYPTRTDLLSDLAYFHEFENMLTTLITHFTRACETERDLEAFTQLAQEFYYATIPDGYEALYALRDSFVPHTEKRTIIDFLIQEKEESAGFTMPYGFEGKAHPVF